MANLEKHEAPEMFGAGDSTRGAGTETQFVEVRLPVELTVNENYVVSVVQEAGEFQTTSFSPASHHVTAVSLSPSTTLLAPPRERNAVPTQLSLRALRRSMPCH